MKGFLARYHQVLAIAASAAVIAITGGTLTGIILAGRHGGSHAVAGPTPSPTFDTSAPTLSPSQSPSGSASASPGAGGASPQPGGPLATPIGFGNGGAGCLGLTNCTPGARATQAPVAAPGVTATYAAAGALAHGRPVSAGSPDGNTIFFTEGSSGYFGSVTASSTTPNEFQISGVSTPMGMFFDTVRGQVWVINAQPGAPTVVEFDAAPFGNHPHVFAVPAPGQFRNTVDNPIALEGITVDQNGDAWFSEFQDTTGPMIGHIFGSTVENCPVKLTGTGQQGGNPMSIALGKDSNLYIGTTNGLGKWAQPSGKSCLTTPGTYLESRPAGCGTTGSNGYIEALAVGPDGNMWFGTPLGVGEYKNGSAQMVACNTNNGLSGDHFAIVTAPDPSQAPHTNALWAAFSGASAGGSAGVARIFSTIGTPINATGTSASSDFRAIVPDNAGNLWIADSSGRILEAKPAKA